ncbi:MAG: hypothetical protein ACI9XO_004445 [Paraglaciecola sp.]|jgi:hypothetical protein
MKSFTFLPYFVKNSLQNTLFCLFLLVFTSNSAQSQSIFEIRKEKPKRETFLRVVSQSGKLLRRKGPFILTPNEEGYTYLNTLAFNLEYGWQTSGDSEWEGICNYPRFGIGIQKFIFRHRDELGNPISFYGFLNGNFIRRKRFQWLHQWGAGLALGFNTYDPNVTPANDLIGSKVNAYIEAGTSFSFLIGSRLSLEPGIRLTHFSNGNTRKPQKGLNIFAYQLGVRYNMTKAPKEYTLYDKTKCRHRHEVLASIGVGERQVDFTAEDNSLPPLTYGLKYLMSNLTLGYNYEVRHQLKIGGGFDIFYDGTNGALAVMNGANFEKNDISFGEKMGVFGYIGIEAVMDRFSLAINVSYILLQQEFPTSSPKFQQRLGLKYHVWRNVFVGIDIIAYEFHVAKAVNYKVGMRHYLNEQ